MLLGLPIMQHAGVNALLLPCNNPALFIHHSVCKITGAVSLFLFTSSNSIFCLLQLQFCGFGIAAQRPLLSRNQINKRRGMV